MTTNQQTKPTVDHETVQRMYRRMLLARGVEDLMVRWVKDQTFRGWWHPGRGQEACGIGLMAALAPEDKIMWYHRGAIWPIARGMSLELILADLLGRTNGSVNGKGAGAPHWTDDQLGLVGSGGTLGTTFVIGGGIALAHQVLGKPGIVISGFGEGTAARGTFHETLIQAAVWKLPLLYFCENNGWAVSTSFARSSPTPTVAERAAAYGIPGEVVDGQDAVAVYEASRRAAEYVRAGNGPMILEARTYRLEGHYYGDMGSYRPRDELDDYRDPVEVLRAHVDAAAAARIAAEAEVELEAAAKVAVEGPVPGRHVIFEDLYA
jgi:pyruvate dehydrogenase E1 component alpha subunit